jgi:carbamoyl-phosphate synthase large subunit
MNIQYAVKNEEVFILEVNPRASRTVPFVSKAIGKPLAKIAAKLMVGKTLKEVGLTEEIIPSYRSVKEAVFPFSKFPGVDTLLGPEMKSTGEVMGIDPEFGMAFAKAEMAAGTVLPLKGKAFISVRDQDKKEIISLASSLIASGFKIMATHGTAQFLKSHSIQVEPINKVMQGSPHIVDKMQQKEIDLVINTHEGKLSAIDSFSLRRTALLENIPYFTTLSAAKAAVMGIKSLKERPISVVSLQSYRQS